MIKEISVNGEPEDGDKYIPCVVKNLNLHDIEERDLAGWSVRKMFEVVESVDIFHDGKVQSVGCYFEKKEAREHAEKISQDLGEVRDIFVLTDGKVGFRIPDESDINMVICDEQIKALEERVKSSKLS